MVVVDIKVKNDGLTQDNAPSELALMILESLSHNRLCDLPWVIASDYHLVTGPDKVR
jgi:hypothetical protein